MIRSPTLDQSDRKAQNNGARMEDLASSAFLATRSERMEFTLRAQCPCCSNPKSSVLWQGRYSDPDVAGFMAQFHYNADLDKTLGDQPFELVRCTDCGMTYHRHVMTERWVPVVYGQWTDAGQVARFEAAHTAGRADPYHTGVQFIKLVMRLRDLVQRQPDTPLPIRLLDFGCGDGQVLAAARLIGLDATGIEVSDSRIDTARHAGLTVLPDLAAFDAQGGGAVDAVVLSQVLEHVSDPLGLLRALAGRMRAGGVIHVAVPDCQGMTRPTDFNTFHHLQPLEHLNAFTPATLERIVAKAGFRPVRAPMACVTSRLSGMIRSLGGRLFRPRTTDQFFQRL